MRSVRSRFGTMVALILGTTLWIGNPLWAQVCGAPVAGVAAPAAVATTIYRKGGPGGIGENLVGIPAFSPVNDPAAGNGFVQLCAIFGLAGTTSQIKQVNSQTGAFTVFDCSSLIPPSFQPCQAVLIEPTIGPVAGIIPIGADPGGAVVEGSWSYSIYGDGSGILGDHLFGVPRTMADVNGNGRSDPEDICLGLGLLVGGFGTQILRVNAQTGVFQAHNCGMVPQFDVTPGEAVLIRSGCGLPGALCGVGSMPID